MKELTTPVLKTVKEIKEMLLLITSYPDKFLHDLESFPIPICLFDEQGIYHEVNQAYCDMVEYSRDELIGHSFFKTIPKENRKMASEELSKWFYKDHEISGKLLEGESKNGYRFPIVYDSVNLLKINGEKLRIVISAKISDLDQIELKVQQTVAVLNENIKTLKNQLQSEEVARNILLHDIKKPFHNILGVCEIIGSGALDPKELQLWVETIREICQKGLQQTLAMQSITKIEMGNYQLKAEKVDMLLFLRHMKKNMEVTFNNKSLKCNILCNQQSYISENLCNMEADPLLLELLFSNLLLNAAEASPENETVTVTLNMDEHNVLIKIHNQGAVPESIRADFFKKYVTKGKPKGTGMGTYIAKLIAEAHQGKIVMISDESFGTLITVRLPRRQSQHLAA